MIIPTAQTGIFGSILLAFGRAIGETMALAMLVGNTAADAATFLSALHNGLLLPLSVDSYRSSFSSSDMPHDIAWSRCEASPRSIDRSCQRRGK